MTGSEENVEGEFKTVPEAARLLRIHPTRVRQFCRQGRIGGARRVGRDWIIPKIDLEVFALQHAAYRPGRPKIDREMKEICRRYGLPDDIVITSEEKEAIDENIAWFLRLTPGQRVKANERHIEWSEVLRRAGRTTIRS